mgnify:CR=1 FL=1
MKLLDVSLNSSLSLLLNDRREVERDSLPFVVDVAENNGALRLDIYAQHGLVDGFFGGHG